MSAKAAANSMTSLFSPSRKLYFLHLCTVILMALQVAGLRSLESSTKLMSKMSPLATTSGASLTVEHGTGKDYAGPPDKTVTDKVSVSPNKLKLKGNITSAVTELKADCLSATSRPYQKLSTRIASSVSFLKAKS